MPIQFVPGTLEVEDTPILEYFTRAPTWTIGAGLTVSDVPYVRHTEVPRIKWTVLPDGTDPVRFDLRVAWIGTTISTSVSQEEVELEVSNLINNFYNIAIYERLVHTLARDAGGLYRIVVTATQTSITDEIAGIVRINFRPTRPVNLIIT